MKSIISEIFDGERGTDKAGKSDKFRQKQAIEIYESFLNTLNENQKKMFEEVLDKMFSLETEQSKSGFAEGFKLGLLVAFEAAEYGST